MSLSLLILCILICTIIVYAQNKSASNFLKNPFLKNWGKSRYDFSFLDFPYFVNVFSNYQLNVHTYKFICSASLISFYWALTAASCKNPDVPKGRNTSYLISAGIVPDPFIAQNPYVVKHVSGQRRPISNWIIHPHYLKNYTNDIALLQVEQPFALNSYVNLVRPIPYAKLHGCDVSALHKSCSALLFDGGVLRPGSHIIILTVFLTNVDKCQITVQKHKFKARPYHICSTNQFMMSHVGCLGNLGSPLICNGSLVGIMLGNFGCSKNDSNSWGLYTRVDLYQSWIMKHVTMGLWYVEAKSDNDTVICVKNRRLYQSTVSRSRRIKFTLYEILLIFHGLLS